MEASAVVQGILTALSVFGLLMLYRWSVQRAEKTTRLYFFERGKLAGVRSTLGRVRNMYALAVRHGESADNSYIGAVIAWNVFSAFMDDLRCSAPAGHSKGGAEGGATG